MSITPKSASALAAPATEVIETEEAAPPPRGRGAVISVTVELIEPGDIITTKPRLALARDVVECRITENKHLAVPYEENLVDVLREEMYDAFDRIHDQLAAR